MAIRASQLCLIRLGAWGFLACGRVSRKVECDVTIKSRKNIAAAKKSLGVSDAAAGPPRSGTADRILETALKLFNERGFRNVSALMIAKHLDISHGNLAYHFKTKSDIVLAVFPQLEADARDAKSPDGPFLPSEAVKHQVDFGTTLWHYRFFFNALTHLLGDGDRLTQRFLDLQERLIGALRDLLDELIAQGYMRIIESLSTYEIARACWLMWLSWLRFEHIAHPRNEEPSEAALYDAIGLISIILGPYFSPEFRAMMSLEVRKALPNALKDGASRRSAGSSRRAAAPPRWKRKQTRSKNGNR